MTSIHVGRPLAERLNTLCNGDDIDQFLHQLLDRYEATQDLPSETDILESIQDAFFALSPSWDFIYVNNEAERLMARTREYLLGRNVWEVFPEALGTDFEDAYTRAYETQQPVNFVAHFPPLQSWFEVRAYPTPDHIAVYFREISARIHQEQRLRMILDNLDIVLYNISADGAITYVEGADLGLVGLQQADLLGKHFADLHFEAPDLEACVREALTGVTSYRRLEVLGAVMDNWVAPYFNDGDHLAGVTGIAMDASASQQAERAQVLQTEVNQLRLLNDMKNRMMTMLSHELRTPLTIIHSSAEILQHYADRLSEEKRAKRLDSIVQQIDRLTMVLGDLENAIGLEVSPPHPELQPVEVDTLMQQLQQNLAGSLPGNLDLQVHIKGTPVPIEADAQMLKTIAANLTENATKYSPDGGLIKFTLDYTHPTEFTVLCTDQGVGIHPDDQPFIFASLFRGRNVDTIQGTGLGLHAVWHHVQSLGGRIMVESELDKGTTVIMVFPKT